jgi:glycosyltransferase involved in cell wall biosynthesis
MIMISVILPAKNEEEAICDVLTRLRHSCPDAELIVVDDGSTDDTATKAHEVDGVRVCRQPYSMGNGAAIKRGIREASGDVLVFMDSDGQHDPAEIPGLLNALDEGYDMVVGSRTGRMHASFGRRMANWIYNRLASWISGHNIVDLTSGFRAVHAHRIREYLYLLPNGFSYPTTATMSFLRSGYSVAFRPINVGRREGMSHIRIMNDGIRFFVIIFKIATLYSPLKLFFPVSAVLFAGGLSYYFYTFMTQGRFTNMSALIILTAIVVFLVGLISEQITTLMHQKR